MKNKTQKDVRWIKGRRGFTLIEIVLAVGLLVIVLSMTGVIFNVSIDSHRMAMANAEVMQKMRAITSQLDSDFKALRKDGEIFVVYCPAGIDEDNDGYSDRYEMFDRIMFFANGDFQSYHHWSGGTVRGNLARITYMIARDARGIAAPLQKDASKRVLSRTQHIFSSDMNLDNFPDLSPFVIDDFRLGNYLYEHDVTTMEEWKNIPAVEKYDILSAVTGVRVNTSLIADGGTTVDLHDPNTIQNLMAKGVGQFRIQSWYEKERRWYPQIDPDNDGSLTDDTDYKLTADLREIDPCDLTGVLYPYRKVAGDQVGGVFAASTSSASLYPRTQVKEDNFDNIPGLGKALKFTFTLYDSKGLLKDGRVFTHIVYLND